MREKSHANAIEHREARSLNPRLKAKKATPQQPEAHSKKYD